MVVTVIVRAAGPDKTRLTFDGTQRVVIGRGPGSDVRLPDASVSHRHATLRAQGAEFVIVDEGSTNGTFVGEVRIAPNTSRLVRSGDAVRVGRIWLELRMDLSPITRDLALATRDLALALVSQAIAAAGKDATPRVRVVEGVDQASTLPLAEFGREYLVGRGPHCDLILTDADVSREHIRVTRLRDGVLLIDADTKNGTSVGSLRVPAGQAVAWRPIQMVRIGGTVLSLEEPLSDALARIESSPDERLSPITPTNAGDPVGVSSSPVGREDSLARAVDPAAGPEGLPSPALDSPEGHPVASGFLHQGDAPSASLKTAAPVVGVGARPGRNQRWSATDVAVMTAAVGVLAMSLAGLVWLLRG